MGDKKSDGVESLFITRFPRPVCKPCVVCFMIKKKSLQSEKYMVAFFPKWFDMNQYMLQKRLLNRSKTILF